MVSVMSCYRPMLMRWNGEESKIEGRWDPDMAVMFPGSFPIPCGHCLGCRLDYSRQWADRMLLELDHSKSAIFVTLTYDNEHVRVSMLDDEDFPSAYTLWKPDLQAFLKRLRSRKKFEDREIRFYASGEYGDTTQRPHYHLILFGLSLEDFPDRRPHGFNELMQQYYISEELQDIWSNGFTLMTAVSWQTFAYVSRYVLKKVNSPVENDPAFRNSEPEFALMSRRPGLAGYYLVEHSDVFDKDCIYLPSSGEAKKVTLPKYLFNKLKLTDPLLYDSISSERSCFARDRVLLKMQQTDLSFVQLMELEENNKWMKIHQLKRK